MQSIRIKEIESVMSQNQKHKFLTENWDKKNMQLKLLNAVKAKKTMLFKT